MAPRAIRRWRRWISARSDAGTARWILPSPTAPSRRVSTVWPPTPRRPAFKRRNSTSKPASKSLRTLVRMCGAEKRLICVHADAPHLALGRGPRTCPAHSAPATLKSTPAPRAICRRAIGGTDSRRRRSCSSSRRSRECAAMRDALQPGSRPRSREPRRRGLPRRRRSCRGRAAAAPSVRRDTPPGTRLRWLGRSPRARCAGVRALPPRRRSMIAKRASRMAGGDDRQRLRVGASEGRDEIPPLLRGEPQDVSTRSSRTLGVTTRPSTPVRRVAPTKASHTEAHERSPGSRRSR